MPDLKLRTLCVFLLMTLSCAIACAAPLTAAMQAKLDRAVQDYERGQLAQAAGAGAAAKSAFAG